MSADRLPVSVVSGFLGAGKTTLINKLLAEDHGMALMVMVNDFGSINIDASLIRNTSGDTIELTNGCVCCTMGGDLIMSLADALDRRPRPDHVVIEASGISDPARIANAALAEPELRHAGIITVVDAQVFEELEYHEHIGAQYRQQIANADLVILRQPSNASPATIAGVRRLLRGKLISDDLPDRVAPLLLDRDETVAPDASETPHAQYARWHADGRGPSDREALERAFQEMPGGILRLKGFVQTGDGLSWEVQVVGKRAILTSTKCGTRTQLVALGLRRDLDVRQVTQWWDTAISRTLVP